jgi:hypothetical protein
MNIFKKTHTIAAAVVAAGVLAVGIWSMTGPAEATVYCNWTAAHGNVCVPG